VYCANARQQTPEYKDVQKARRQTPEYKDVQKARRQTPEYKAYQKAYQKAYRKTQKYHDSRQKYEQSQGGKSARRGVNTRRRSRVKTAGGSLSASEWRGLCRHYDYNCLRCGKQLPQEDLTVDHVTSVANGGTSGIGNIQPLCMSCNCSKGANNTDYRKHYNDENGRFSEKPTCG